MRNFRYTASPDLQAAMGALTEPDAAIIAGGTELTNWMRLGILEPAVLVDVRNLAPKDRISREGDVLRISAFATLNDVGENASVREYAGALSQACLKAASAQVRNRATLGGNVLQKTRCAYFRADAPLPWGCNKRAPGSGCAARHGSNERLAIFGWTDICVATQPSDPAVALACLDAEAEVQGAAGRRTIALTDFYLTPSEAAAEARLPSPAHAAQVETRLSPGEIITGYRVRLSNGERSAYVKVRERESYEYALVSAAASVAVENGVIRRARVALGSVAQKPWRLPTAEAALSGQPLEREAVLAPIRAALAQAQPLEHNAYKVELAAKVALRAVLTAGGAT